MTAARGFVYAVYTADDGSQYSKQVQRNYADDPIRGWAPLPDTAMPPLFPIRGRPRMVFGVSPTTGRRNSTIVASTAAPLWGLDPLTRVDVFQSETDSGSSDDYQVTRRRGESFAVVGQRPALP